MVMKHSWKGKYKRIFSVGLSGITTHNPSNMESTNTWLYQVNLKGSDWQREVVELSMQSCAQIL